MHPTPYHTLPAHPKGEKIKIIIKTMASQVLELLCQLTDWMNLKFYKVCGHLKWFSPVKPQYALSQCQHFPPYIRFEGVVELCSWFCWLSLCDSKISKSGLLGELLLCEPSWEYSSNCNKSDFWGPKSFAQHVLGTFALWLAESRALLWMRKK